MRKNKIFIIGNDDVSTKNVANILKDLGYSSITNAVAGENLLAAVEKKKPHLLLVNSQPRGWRKVIEITRKIYERMGTPALILAERSETGRLKQAMKTLPCGFLLKPVDKQSLSVAIETTLARHALEEKYKDKMNRSLRESEARYSQLVDNISEGVVIQDKNGIITSANERFLEMIGYKRREVIGRPITAFLGEGWLKKGAEPGAAVKDGWRSIELAWKRKDDKRIYTILSRKPIYDAEGRFEGSVSVLTDITDRREVELELRRSQEELRNLSQHIQSVREKESKRIAAEIHDVLGQQLTALKIDLSWFKNWVTALGESGQEIQGRISAMFDLIDKTIQSVQKISAELRPVMLDDLGLCPAIEWLAQDFESRTKITCRASFGCDYVDLDPDSSTAIFRVSQEALTNVTRHAGATAVDINLDIRNEALVLKISDNGRGIQQEEINAPTSLGLMGMRERLRPFGGKLEICGSREKGTALTITIPIKKAIAKTFRE